MAMMDMVQLKLENFGPTFSSFNDMLQKSPKITTEVPFFSLNLCFLFVFPDTHYLR